MTQHKTPRRYALAKTQSGEILMLSKASAAMLKHIAGRREATYASTKQATGLPENTLYVFAQRLADAGLIVRQKRLHRGRMHTFLSSAEAVEFGVKVRRV